MATVTPVTVMLAIAIVVGLATVCQVLAPRLRVPSLILLLPVGFLLGVVAPQLRLDVLLGPAWPVMVDLVVAIILFHGGLELSSSTLDRSDHRAVRRLVWVGGALTFVGAAAAAHLILDMSWPVAFMLGAIVIVSGPTVVTPILDFAGLHGRVRDVLQWEGTFLDPIGALVAVVVFQAIHASGQESFGRALGSFALEMVVGVVAAAVGVVLFIIGGRLVRGSQLLGTQVLLGTVVLVAGLADAVSQDTGLLAALLMGMVAPRIARRFGASLESSQDFFGTIVSIGIGVLFVSIAALVPASMVAAVLLPTLALTAILVIVLRPLVALIGTARSDLSTRERIFVAGMDPRGIVAAATASSVGAALIATGEPGAVHLLPVTFLVVTITVALYGVAAIPLARRLGLAGSGSPTP